MRQMRLFTLTLFVLTFVTASAPAQYKVLHNFGSKSGDPAEPNYSTIIAQGRDGNLYSTSTLGGANGLGAVFKITPAGALTVLYSFTGGTDGFYPESGLTLGTDGNFYGTTTEYSSGCGTVFKITPSGSLTTLYAFKCGSDGDTPTAAPVQGTDGKLYGTTSGLLSGYGTIYKITLPSTFTLLHEFDVTHGYQPWDPLVQGTDGNFYGTTVRGGTSDVGVVFKITPTGSFTVLYNFDSAHGSVPYSPLVQGSDGNFYGTTLEGGANSYGEVFKITPGGTLTVLHSMNYTTDGGHTYAGLVQATDGNFYGANSAGGTSGVGTIFKSPPFSVLYTFNGTSGSTPYVTPFQHTNSILYGDTFNGGTNGYGVFYSLNLSLKAFVTLIPYSGKVGNTIEFLGQGFTSSSTVSFNGTKSPRVKVAPSGTYLTATVPNVATTGFVTVTTSGGTLKSNKIFRVVP